jgi:hypothetical protein
LLHHLPLLVFVEEHIRSEAITTALKRGEYEAATRATIAKQQQQ